MDNPVCHRRAEDPKLARHKQNGGRHEIDSLNWETQEPYCSNPKRLRCNTVNSCSVWIVNVGVSVGHDIARAEISISPRGTNSWPV